MGLQDRYVYRAPRARFLAVAAARVDLACAIQDIDQTWKAWNVQPGFLYEQYWPLVEQNEAVHDLP